MHCITQKIIPVSVLLRILIKTRYLFRPDLQIGMAKMSGPAFFFAGEARQIDAVRNNTAKIKLRFILRLIPDPGQNSADIQMHHGTRHTINLFSNSLAVSKLCGTILTVPHMTVTLFFRRDKTGMTFWASDRYKILTFLHTQGPFAGRTDKISVMTFVDEQNKE